MLELIEGPQGHIWFPPDRQHNTALNMVTDELRAAVAAMDTGANGLGAKGISSSAGAGNPNTPDRGANHVAINIDTIASTT